MRLRPFFLLILFFLVYLESQILGSVSDTSGNPIPSVNVYIENTFTGTTTNENGEYSLNISETNSYTVIFQLLGYKTERKIVAINKFPYELNTTLQEEEISLDEVIINSGDNPANRIIRAAIANRERYLNKIKSYSADFYSRGLIKIKDAPQSILGQDLGDLGGGLDSTRSGIVYLSETISKIQFLQPNNLKERIVASKVSGDDNGFSFNAASDVYFNFYNNTVELGNQIVSPIADFAFNYYNYKLDGVFYDNRGNLINKIQVIPKRKNDRIFSGTIYIVENQWAIYGVELDITGQQAQIPPADVITLNQNYNYSEEVDIWALISQKIDFTYGIFGIKGSGTFTAVYTDYVFNIGLNKKDFGNEILSFEENANQKDSLYWQEVRPVPLTMEEKGDYLKKDSIQVLRKSKPYLDSIDAVQNRFKPFNLVSGYRYQNSFKDFSIGIGSPLGKLRFNTVQGFNTDLNLSYRKNYDEFRRYLQIGGSLNYGFSNERLYPRFTLTYKFNNIQRNTLSFAAGSMVTQFNTSLSSLERLNSFYSLLAEENYLKVYENRFAQVNYFQEVFNGLRVSTNLSYQNRLPLFNTTDQIWFPQEDKSYTSNNPLDIDGYGIAPFQNHSILKFQINATITFGQTYMSYPDSKFNIPNDKYPSINLGYESGMASNISEYNFSQVKAGLSQEVNLANKGTLHYNLKAGKFLNSEGIAFMDFQHFNGNQTNIGTSSRYLNVFNNLPYYALSTNDSYFEGHLEHDFSGYILGKIPLLNKLNYNLILGGHLLSTPANNPYSELSIGLDNIGWGKFRFLRLDYVRSYQSGFQSDALIFGLKFLNFID